MKETTSFLNKFCYRNAPKLIDDTIVVCCTFCGKEAFRREDVKHKRDCELANVMKELQLLEKDVKVFRNKWSFDDMKRRRALPVFDRLAGYFTT